MKNIARFARLFLPTVYCKTTTESANEMKKEGIFNAWCQVCFPSGFLKPSQCQKLLLCNTAWKETRREDVDVDDSGMKWTEKSQLQYNCSEQTWYFFVIDSFFMIS